MKLRINGEDREIDGASNVAELVDALALPPTASLVEHNGVALRRTEWSSSLLSEGDAVEIIRIVAGG